MSAMPQRLADLHPAYFALVMATGIVSISAELLEIPWVGLALFGLNLVAYAVLWVLTLMRLARFPAQVLADLAHHNRCAGFFTIVAATCIVGNQFLVIVFYPLVAIGLWFFGIVLWALATYTVFTILTVKPEKPSLATGIDGGWLVAVVAAQSVATLGGFVAIHFDAAKEVVLFFSLVMWLGGGMLYVWIISLIFYRYTFFPLSVVLLTPPYWINMGAMAISTLAGTVLIANAQHWSLLAELLPFLKGMTLLFWSTATWWIPMLVILGVWRHVYHRFPLRYDAMYWGAVFPLGMYTVCTLRLSQVIDAPFLMTLPHVTVYAGMAAWAVTFCGLIVNVVRPSGS